MFNNVFFLRIIITRAEGKTTEENTGVSGALKKTFYFRVLCTRKTVMLLLLRLGVERGPKTHRGP